MSLSKIEPGSIIVGINGKRVTSLQYSETISLVRTSIRPLSLRLKYGDIFPETQVNDSENVDEDAPKDHNESLIEEKSDRSECISVNED